MAKKAKANSDSYLRMYSQMAKIRAFEDRANQLYLDAKMPGLTHMYSGQEAVAVGICEALNVTDKITSTHRGHGHCVAKGAELKEMFCELLGKEEGYCRGKGGSMHIADQSNGNLGANAIVGGSMGIATGSALRAKLNGEDDVTVCFFGDGATAQGLMYEVMNMAALWKLPVIYACENNGYSEYTATDEIAAGNILDRARAFGLEAHQVDGQDVLAVNKLALDLVDRARNGKGPFFIELLTYRYHGHHVGDISRTYYRPKEEEDHWKKNRDPIKILGDWLISEKISSSDDLKKVIKEIELNQEKQKTYRPWGWFEVIYSGSNHKVKKLHISPKSKLSLQSHTHRAENWTIVSGTAQVTKNDKTFQLNEGESIFIPKGSKHSIENKTQKYIDIIEVQTGSYLEEDDIVRYEDLYGRI